MPNIFDNIDSHLLPALRTILSAGFRLDVLVGYFQLRGWDNLADIVERFLGTDDFCCHLIVGMQRPPDEIMRSFQCLARDGNGYLDGPTVVRLHLLAARSFEEQIEFSVPYSQSIAATLRAIACAPETPALPNTDNHHELVAKGLYYALQEQSTFGGQLGSLRSTRRQVYEWVKRGLEHHHRYPTLFSRPYLDHLLALNRGAAALPAARGHPAGRRPADSSGHQRR